MNKLTVDLSIVSGNILLSNISPKIEHSVMHGLVPRQMVLLENLVCAILSDYILEYLLIGVFPKLQKF